VLFWTTAARATFSSATTTRSEQRFKFWRGKINRRLSEGYTLEIGFRRPIGRASTRSGDDEGGTGLDSAVELVSQEQDLRGQAESRCDGGATLPPVDDLRLTNTRYDADAECFGPVGIAGFVLPFRRRGPSGQNG